MSGDGSWPSHDADPNAAFWSRDADQHADSGSSYGGYGYFGQQSPSPAPSDPYAAPRATNSPQDQWSQPFDGSTQPPLVPYSPSGFYARPNHPNGVPAIVLGVIGFFFPILSPIALAMAIRGRKDVREHPEAYSGADSLTAGLVLGAIGTALLALYLLMVAVLLVIVVAAA